MNRLVSVDVSVSKDLPGESSTLNNPVNDPTLLKLPEDKGDSAGTQGSNSKSNLVVGTNEGTPDVETAVSSRKGKGRAAAGEKDDIPDEHSGSDSEEEAWGGECDENEEEVEPHTLELHADRQLHNETKLFLQDLPDNQRRAKISWLDGMGAYEFERENNIMRNKYLMARLFEGKTVTELLFASTPVATPAPSSAALKITENDPTPLDYAATPTNPTTLTPSTLSNYAASPPTPSTPSAHAGTSTTPHASPQTTSELTPPLPTSFAPIISEVPSLNSPPERLSPVPDPSLTANMGYVETEVEQCMSVDLAGCPRWLSEAYTSLDGPMPTLWKSIMNDWALLERYYGFSNPSGQVCALNYR